MNYRITIILLAITMIPSCYQKELFYSFDTSYGGVIVGSSCYYLAQVREYKSPKGISRFPDGGQSKEIRQLFGLFKTDSMSKSTIMVTRLPEIHGWPSRYATRMEKKGSYIVIGIINVTLPDSINGIYIYDLKKDEIRKYCEKKALPSISQDGTQIAYCYDNKLMIDDFPTHTSLASFHITPEPVFLTWKSKEEILLFFSDPFRVMVINVISGNITASDLKYIPNYGQDANATDIKNFVKQTSPDLKGLLN
jgi:hypothetical protein